jgi:succinate dehydrogenase/fumarate reductase iron-sulfur protein
MLETKPLDKDLYTETRQIFNRATKGQLPLEYYKFPELSIYKGEMSRWWRRSQLNSANFLNGRVFCVKIKRFSPSKELKSSLPLNLELGLAENPSPYTSIRTFPGFLATRSVGQAPLSWVQTYYVDRSFFRGEMVLDLLIHIKNVIDPTLSFRRSCREGICGSCAMNINGHNTLACLKQLPQHTFSNPTLITSLKQAGSSYIHGEPAKNHRFYSRVTNIQISGLPHAKPLRDLIPNVSFFYKHYKSISPWLHTSSTRSTSLDSKTPSYSKKKQSVEDRSSLDGLYECILCLCCSHACPSYWWNSEKYLGPAVLLQAFRWISDTRDDSRRSRLRRLSTGLKIYGCHSILSCTKTCPKHLNPGQAVSNLKLLASTVKKPSVESREKRFKRDFLYTPAGWKLRNFGKIRTAMMELILKKRVIKLSNSYRPV